MRRAPVLLALGSLAAAGCIDFVAPARPSLFRQGSIAFASTLVDTTPPRLRVSALVLPSVDSAGAVGPLAHDTLRAIGLDLAPIRTTPDSARIYDATVDLDAGVLATGRFTVEFPLPQGAPVDWAILAWPIVWRAGPDTVVVERGSDWLVTFALPVTTGDPVPTFEGWTVYFSAPGHLSLTMEGTGLPTDTVAVPGALLSTLPAGDYRGHAWLVQGLSLGEINDEYRFGVNLAINLRWIVRLVDSQPRTHLESSGNARPAPPGPAPRRSSAAQ